MNSSCDGSTEADNKAWTFNCLPLSQRTLSAGSESDRMSTKEDYVTTAPLLTKPKL